VEFRHWEGGSEKDAQIPPGGEDRREFRQGGMANPQEVERVQGFLWGKTVSKGKEIFRRKGGRVSRKRLWKGAELKTIIYCYEKGLFDNPRGGWTNRGEPLRERNFGKPALKGKGDFVGGAG